MIPANAPDAFTCAQSGCRRRPAPLHPAHPALQLCLAETSLLTDQGFEALEGLTALRELDVSCWIVRRPAASASAAAASCQVSRSALCMPCPALPCPALPCPALPCPAPVEVLWCG
jgi:hypothetical protein